MFSRAARLKSYESQGKCNHPGTLRQELEVLEYHALLPRDFRRFWLRQLFRFYRGFSCFMGGVGKLRSQILALSPKTLQYLCCLKS